MLDSPPGLGQNAVYGLLRRDMQRVEDVVKRLEKQYRNQRLRDIPPFPAGIGDVLIPAQAGPGGILAGDGNSPKSGQVTLCNPTADTFPILRATGATVDAVNWWTMPVPANALCLCMWWRGNLIIVNFNCGPSVMGS